jgi:hypothetical protein
LEQALGRISACAAATLLVVLTGCTSPPADPAPTSVGGTPAPSAVVLQPVKITPEKFSERIVAAADAAGGVRIQATFPEGSLSGRFQFGPLVAPGVMRGTKGQGRMQGATGSARYVYRFSLLPSDNAVWVDDGTTINGRTWARLPLRDHLLRDREQIKKDHPRYLAPGAVMRSLQPDQIRILLAGATDLFRTPARETVDGVATTHYLWGIGADPTVGGKNTFEVWLDPVGRPVRLRALVNGILPADVKYTDWGPQTVKLPAAADTSVLPLKVS